MINIWKYQDETRIRIIDVDGNAFAGNIVELTDVGEESEDYGYGEDSITIESEGRHIVFPQSEIWIIEVIS